MVTGARLFVFAPAALAISSCNESNYWPNEIGDQIELVNSKNRELVVEPDVVFYDVLGTEVYGVQRLGDNASTQLGFWAKCRLFHANAERVTYLNERDVRVANRNSRHDAALSFAKEHCFNFGAPRRPG